MQIPTKGSQQGFLSVNEESNALKCGGKCTQKEKIATRDRKDPQKHIGESPSHAQKGWALHSAWASPTGASQQGSFGVSALLFLAMLDAALPSSSNKSWPMGALELLQSCTRGPCTMVVSWPGVTIMAISSWLFTTGARDSPVSWVPRTSPRAPWAPLPGGTVLLAQCTPLKHSLLCLSSPSALFQESLGVLVGRTRPFLLTSQSWAHKERGRVSPTE
jgi:hypothetical protein